MSSQETSKSGEQTQSKPQRLTFPSLIVLPTGNQDKSQHLLNIWLETRKNRILLGLSGSVATIKGHLIAQKLANCNFEVKIVATKNSLPFLHKNELPNSVEVFDDDIEWTNWKTKEDEVLHVQVWFFSFSRLKKSNEKW